MCDLSDKNFIRASIESMCYISDGDAIVTSRSGQSNLQSESLLCEFCGATLANLSCLKDHITDHIKDEPYISDSVLTFPRFISQPQENPEIGTTVQNGLGADQSPDRETSTSGEPLAKKTTTYLCEVCGKRLRSPGSIVSEQDETCCSCKLHTIIQIGETMNNKPPITSPPVANENGISKLFSEALTQKVVHPQLSLKALKVLFAPVNLLTVQPNCPLPVITDGNAIIRPIEKNIAIPLLCEFCGKTFNKTTQLKVHQAVHNNTRAWVCEFCGKCFNQNGHLINHRRVHSGEKPYKCEICGRTFARLSGICCHRLTHSAEKPTFKCIICKKDLSSMSCLKTHLDTHTKPYTCDLCEATFSVKSSLKHHVLGHSNHNNEYHHLCDLCGKAFSRRSNLRSHMAIHTGVKPYSCNACSKSYCNRNELKIHCRIHQEVKPFPCKFCPKTFHTNYNLRLHLRIHTGEKPYSCEECRKSFSQSGSLKSHMFIHRNEKPFVCKVCYKAFRQSTSLRVHARIHLKGTD